MAKPEKSFRVGPISASVFVNEPKGKAKRVFRSVSLQRRYKDGEQWKTSNSFTLGDLPTAIAVLHMAMNHMVVQDAESTTASFDK
jgi:hypothetical protein